jgi:hypothetical protein
MCSRVAILTLGIGLAACGGQDSPAPGSNGTGGGAPPASGSGGAMGADAGAIDGQATGSGGGGAGNAPGTGGAAATTDAGGAGGEAGGVFPKADCAPGAIVCDGFEDYPILPKPFDAMNNLYDLIKIGDTMPTWLSYHFHGPPRVDASKPYKGKQNYHVDTESGHGAAADIIKESPDGVDLWPAAHYGRVMVWLNAIPPKSAWGIMSESGLLPGSTTDVAEYTLGGVNGKLSFTYLQRKRIYKNDVSTPKMRRGGNAEFNDPPPLVQCTVQATAAAPKAGAWMCVEWMIDRSQSALHLWIDGVAQTEVDVTGGGGTCAIGTAATWQGPAHFTELDLGWEVYGTDVGQWQAWFDEFALGTQRLNCPTPGQ